MRKRVIVRAAALLLVLAVMVSLNGENHRQDVYQEDNDAYYRDHWTDLETGYRLVKSMSVVSQPEIFYCGELGQQPGMRGVLFRLEYEDGGVEETEFLPARKVRSWYYECSGGWLNYGMVVRAMNYWDPTCPGKRLEAVFFNNAQEGGGGYNSGGYYETPIYADNTELVRTYVEATNLTLEEYFQHNPEHELKPGQPAKLWVERGLPQAFCFTPQADGVYFFRLQIGEDGYDYGHISILDSEGNWHGGFPMNRVALRLRKGERLVLRSSFDADYDWYPIAETVTVSVFPLLKAHRLRAGGEIKFEGGILVSPMIPEEGRYNYRLTNAYAMQITDSEMEFRESWWNIVSRTYSEPHNYYVIGNVDGQWLDWGEGRPVALYPYNNVELERSWDQQPWSTNRRMPAGEFVLFAEEGPGSVAFLPLRKTAVRDITLRVGKAVPLSEIITWDSMQTTITIELSGGECVTVFEQDGIAMLRANKAGKAQMRIKIFQLDETITITVTK